MGKHALGVAVVRAPNIALHARAADSDVAPERQYRRAHVRGHLGFISHGSRGQSRIPLIPWPESMRAPDRSLACREELS